LPLAASLKPLANEAALPLGENDKWLQPRFVKHPQQQWYMPLT